jgi:tripartite-type tricarboxylate transporter receptor subunit TctC
MKGLLSMVSLAVFLVLSSVSAFAQYPIKPIHLIVPFAAGGPSDNAARMIGQALSKSIGQPVIIENRPGANGAIAAQALLAAPADGHTLLWGIASMVAIPLVQRNAPFDSIAEFAPVSLVGRFAFGMYVHPGLPARSVAEFVAYARANAGKLNYATSALGEFMAAAQFMKAAGISMVRVPYKGGAQLMPDLIEGRVQVNFAPVSLGLAHVKTAACACWRFFCRSEARSRPTCRQSPKRACRALRFRPGRPSLRRQKPQGRSSSGSLTKSGWFSRMRRYGHSSSGKPCKEKGRPQRHSQPPSRTIF